ncbi:CarD family transcriptional regulator [Arthrobacter sp. VKM Ac-2550]|uniref:CarD family transcriptional regulator n=1 Tax=Crystallibacter permensis TaxID=1938888 RepID=UPI0022265D2A|nr:CarD family transcriptional regulator [Arthrobacter sp. VKM Ac-2550]MCW2135217.1 transcriptional regulator, CarD family [Arthrobacter sp. VKM Ac-2550]
MKLNVGDSLVYPPHGAVTVTGVTNRSFNESDTKYVQFRVHHDGLMIEVPAAKAKDLGARQPIGKKGVQKVISILRTPVSTEKEIWSRRFKANQEKITNGDVYKISEVVRDLTRRLQSGVAPAGEKRQLEQARRILVSELALSENTDEAGAGAIIDDVLRPEDVEETPATTPKRVKAAASA